MLNMFFGKTGFITIKTHIVSRTPAALGVGEAFGLAAMPRTGRFGILIRNSRMPTGYHICQKVT